MALKFKGAFAPVASAFKVISTVVNNFLTRENGDTLTTEAGVELALDE